jgi:hypothetical protein
MALMGLSGSLEKLFHKKLKLKISCQTSFKKDCLAE